MNIIVAKGKDVFDIIKLIQAKVSKTKLLLKMFQAWQLRNGLQILLLILNEFKRIN